MAGPNINNVCANCQPRPRQCGRFDMRMEMILYVNDDNSYYPVNCESNRRIVAREFVLVGKHYMNATLCGSLFLFYALPADSEDRAKADRVAKKLREIYDSSNSDEFWQATAMETKAANPQLFEELAAVALSDGAKRS